MWQEEGSTAYVTEREMMHYTGAMLDTILKGEAARTHLERKLEESQRQILENQKKFFEMLESRQPIGSESPGFTHPASKPPQADRDPIKGHCHRARFKVRTPVHQYRRPDNRLTISIG